MFSWTAVNFGSVGDDLLCCWLSLSQSSSHVSARRKTAEPPSSRPSGGAEGDSPLRCDAEGADASPPAPPHGSSAGKNDTVLWAYKAHKQTWGRSSASERVSFFRKGKKEGLCVCGGRGWVFPHSLFESDWAPVVGVHACVLHRTGGKSAQDLQGSFFPSEWRRRSRSTGRARRGPWMVAGW